MRENPKFYRHSLWINVPATKNIFFATKARQSRGSLHQKHLVVCETCLTNKPS